MQKRKDIRNFYVDETFMPIWDDFKIICDRECSSASEKIREFIERYVMVHDQGNPQMLIEKFMSELPKQECYFCHGHFPNLMKVKYVSGLVAPTCSICLEQNKGKGPFSTVKKVLGSIR